MLTDVNKSELTGTNIVENGHSQIGGQIDIDSLDTQKFFDDAFNAASGKPVRATTVVPETPAPDVVPEPVKETAPEVTPVVAAEEVVDKAPTSSQEPDPNKWINDLPEDVRGRVLEEINARRYHEQKYKSDIGRQNALQRKILNQQQELADLRSRVIKPQDPVLAAAAQQEANKTLADWNTLIEADPSLAKAVESRIKAERSATISEFQEQLKATVNPLYQQSQSTLEEQERQLLQQEIPNYAEVLQSPVYTYWLNNVAGEGVRALANTSVDHRDAVNVLKMYASDAPGVYDHMVRSGMIQGQAQQVAVTQTEPVKQDTLRADAVAQSRAAKVQAAPVVTQTPNPITPTNSSGFGDNKVGGLVDMDSDVVKAFFDAEFKKHQRR